MLGLNIIKKTYSDDIGSPISQENMDLHCWNFPSAEHFPHFHADGLSRMGSRELSHREDVVLPLPALVYAVRCQTEMEISFYPIFNNIFSNYK